MRRKEVPSSCRLLHHELSVTSSAEAQRKSQMKPLSSLFVCSSSPSTQPTIPVLSEASDRDMNVIFPLVFLTAVLNSYETLKAPQLLPDGSLSQGYLWESLERASILPRKIPVFSLTPFILRHTHPNPSPSLYDACGDLTSSLPAHPPFIKT